MLLYRTLGQKFFSYQEGFVPNMKEFKTVVMIFGRFVPWSFRSRYKKLFRSEPEICLIDSFFYPITERKKNSLFKSQWIWPSPVALIY